MDSAIDAAKKKADDAKRMAKSGFFSLCAPCLSLAGMGGDAVDADDGAQRRSEQQRSEQQRVEQQRGDAQGDATRREAERQRRETEQANQQKKEQVANNEEEKRKQREAQRLEDEARRAAENKAAQDSAAAKRAEANAKRQAEEDERKRKKAEEQAAIVAKREATKRMEQERREQEICESQRKLQEAAEAKKAGEESRAQKKQDEQAAMVAKREETKRTDNERREQEMEDAQQRKQEMNQMNQRQSEPVANTEEEKRKQREAQRLEDEARRAAENKAAQDSAAAKRAEANAKRQAEEDERKRKKAEEQAAIVAKREATKRMEQERREQQMADDDAKQEAWQEKEQERKAQAEQQREAEMRALEEKSKMAASAAAQKMSALGSAQKSGSTSSNEGISVGPHEMNSQGSRAMVSSNATWNSNGSKPFRKCVDLLGASHTLAKAWELSMDDEAMNSFSVFKYTNKEEIKVSVDALPADGATIDLSDGNLSLWYVQAAPLSMPVSCCDVGGGNHVGIMPYVHAVDLYVSVDGREFTDQHICYGSDTGASREAVVSEVERKTIDGEHWSKSLLEGPSDGTQPWATIVNHTRWQTNDSLVYLPLMCVDVDNATLGDEDAYPYVHCLLAKFSQLLGEVGAGEHSVSIRLRPRGYIFLDDDGDCQFDYVGGSVRDAKSLEASAKSLVGEHLTDSSAPGMSAAFKINVSESQANSKGPVRTAQAFATNWPAGEIKQCVELGLKMANTGVCGAKAAQMAPGSKCCHIILTEGNQGSGIKTATFGEERAYDFFCAWALFKNKDAKPDSLGAQIKFVVKRDKIIDYKPVDRDWRSAGFESVTTDTVNGLTISNQEIDAAIARDAEFLK